MKVIIGETLASKFKLNDLWILKSKSNVSIKPKYEGTWKIANQLHNRQSAMKTYVNQMFFQVYIIFQYFFRRLAKSDNIRILIPVHLHGFWWCTKLEELLKPWNLQAREPNEKNDTSRKTISLLIAFLKTSTEHFLPFLAGKSFIIMRIFSISCGHIVVKKWVLYSFNHMFRNFSLFSVQVSQKTVPLHLGNRSSKSKRTCSYKKNEITAISVESNFAHQFRITEKIWKIL